MIPAEINGDHATMNDAELIESVDHALGSVLDSRSLPGQLHDAIHYSLFGGGKRVRPMLVVRACQAVGGEPQVALGPACAIELIHTFSLVHDDLPAMDDDDLRRGRPTLHKHTNEAMAILAGDAMTALAFEALGFGDTASETQITQWTQELSHATNAMIAGQVYDTMGGQPNDLEPIDQLRLTHRHKTGALIGAAVRMGAIAGNGSAKQIESLSTYADAIGLMFQAVDDLLDVTQSADQMGKATGKDAEQGKLTYPGLLGIEGTRAEIDKLLDKALESLSSFGDKAQPLREMAQKLATRQR